MFRDWLILVLCRILEHKEQIKFRQLMLKDKFNPQQGVPTVEFLEVSPGTSGYEPQTPDTLEQEGLAGGAMPSTMPSEMMSGPMGQPAAVPPPSGLG